MTDSSGASVPRVALFRAAVDPVVQFVDVSERRRVTVAVVVPSLFWLIVELAANLGVVPLVVAIGLAAYLYTRDTAQETLAASAYAPGLLAIGVGLFQVFLTVTGGSTEPFVDTVVRLSGWPLAGIALIAFGTWLYRVDLGTAGRP